MPTDADHQQLTTHLADIVALLDERQHVFWRQNLTTARNAIMREDVAGYRRLLSLDGSGYSLPALRLADTQSQSVFDQLVADALRLARQLEARRASGV